MTPTDAPTVMLLHSQVTVLSHARRVPLVLQFFHQR
jgi:hypothetical protein